MSEFAESQHEKNNDTVEDSVKDEADGDQESEGGVGVEPEVILKYEDVKKEVEDSQILMEEASGLLCML